MKRQAIAFICIIILFSSALQSVLPKNAAAASTAEDSKISVPAESTDSIEWPDGPDVYAQSAIIMEASTGLVLYEKNIHDTRYPASITKIMSALLGIENAKLSDTVTFSKQAIFDVDINSSRIGIDVGEKLTMQQCLYAILLESANEVTYGMAEHVAGSVDAFAKMMNERAKSIGCLNTNFVNPHGLHDDNHYTTAYDMALITREAIKNSTFRKIFSTRTYQIPPTNIQSETRYMRNHHGFILGHEYRYEDCIGGKTGYTSVSKYTLVSVAKRGDLELICVIMKDDSNAHQYADTQKLFDFAFDNFSIYSIADLESTQALSESPMFTRYNSLLSDGESPVTTDKNGYLVLPNSASFEDAQKDVVFYSASEAEAVPAADSSTRVIGKISYTYNGKYVGGANILFDNTQASQLIQNHAESNNPTGAPADTSAHKSGRSLRPVILGVIVGFLILIFGLYYFLVERPRLKRRSAYYKKRARRKLYQDEDYLDL